MSRGIWVDRGWRSPEAGINGPTDAIKGLAFFVTTIRQLGLSLTDGTTGATTVLIKTGQQGAVSRADMTSAVTADPVSNLRNLSDHPDDFLSFLTIIGCLLIGNDQGSIDAFPRFGMFESGKGAGGKDTQPQASHGQFHEVATC